MAYCECPEHALQENAACQSCLANYWKSQYHKTQAELAACRELLRDADGMISSRWPGFEGWKLRVKAALAARKGEGDV
jgi:hypothetical protein